MFETFRDHSSCAGARRIAAVGVLLCLAPAQWALAEGFCDDPSLATLPAVGLGTNNSLHWVLPGSPARSAALTGIEGNLIGIDYRPSDAQPNRVYGVTDTGRLYLIDVAAPPYRANPIGTVAPRFAGGYQALADFNPTGAANALRLVGSNDRNFAVTGATLNQTLVQSPLAYVDGDPGAGADPNITAGAYDNNLAGASQTTFYMLDYDRDTLVTIDDRNAAGSSNTAGGRLRTIGPLVTAQGDALNVAPAAGLDVYTSPDGFSAALAVSGQDLYCIDLAAVDPDQPAGSLQKVVAERLPEHSLELAHTAGTGGLIDLAVLPGAPPPVDNRADLAVAASGAVTAVRGRVSLSYSVTLRNLGPAAAESVSLRSTALACGKLPGTVGGCVAGTTQGSCSFGGLQSNLLSCSLGTLASGASAIVRVSGTPVGAAPGSVTSTFSGVGNTQDGNPANNNASVTLTIPEPPLPEVP